MLFTDVNQPTSRSTRSRRNGNFKQLNSMLVKIAERRAQLEQQMLDIEQMHLELDTAQERCEQALAATPKPSDSTC